MQIIQILSDIGAGKRGTDHGVRWLCQRHQIPERDCLIFTNNHPSQLTDPPAKHLDSLLPFFQTFLPTLRQQFQQPQFPVILSGDHANAIGIISALCDAYPDKRIGVIWIDAHADLHTPYTTPSGNIHGMTLAALCRQDNLERGKNEVNEAVKTGWAQLKNLAPTSKGIAAQDLCFLGIRDCEAEEIGLLEQFAIPHFSVETMREKGIDTILAQVKQRFAEMDMVYVSFDVDSIDADLLTATGTPVLNGFNEQELNQIFAQLLSLPNLKAFEITEFNPTLNNDIEQYERVYRLFASALQKIQAR